MSQDHVAVITSFLSHMQHWMDHLLQNCAPDHHAFMKDLMHLIMEWCNTFQPGDIRPFAQFCLKLVANMELYDFASLTGISYRILSPHAMERAQGDEFRLLKRTMAILEFDARQAEINVEREAAEFKCMVANVERAVWEDARLIGFCLVLVWLLARGLAEFVLSRGPSRG